MRFRLTLVFPDYSLIVRVAAYPHPHKTRVVFYRQGAMGQPHSCGPEIPNFLELKLWMSRALLQELKAFVGHAASIVRQGLVPLPELVGRPVHQRSLSFSPVLCFHCFTDEEVKSAGLLDRRSGTHPGHYGTSSSET